MLYSAVIQTLIRCELVYNSRVVSIFILQMTDISGPNILMMIVCLPLIESLRIMEDKSIR